MKHVPPENENIKADVRRDQIERFIVISSCPPAPFRIEKMTNCHIAGIEPGTEWKNIEALVRKINDAGIDFEIVRRNPRKE